MSADFVSVQNFHEQPVFDAIQTALAQFPHMRDSPLLADIACVALNRLPPRYIRHAVDFSFYLSEKEREDNEQMVQDSVRYAFEFVQARAAMRARG